MKDYQFDKTRLPRQSTKVKLAEGQLEPSDDEDDNEEDGDADDAKCDHDTDMIFVKTFTPADFLNLRNLPEKVRNLRHFRGKIINVYHLFAQN